MAQVVFTPNLQRHIECPPTEARGATVREVLEEVFVRHPKAQGYVLDDQGNLRTHMMIFVDGRQMQDRQGLGDPVQDGSEIYIMQALSGG